MTTTYMTKRIQNIRTTILRSLMVVAMIVCGVGESWGTDYVFMTSDNSKFVIIDNSGTLTTSDTFDSKTCIWTGTSGSTFSCNGHTLGCNRSSSGGSGGGSGGGPGGSYTYTPMADGEYRTTITIYNGYVTYAETFGMGNWGSMTNYYYYCYNSNTFTCTSGNNGGYGGGSTIPTGAILAYEVAKESSDYSVNISYPTTGAYIGQVNGTMTISAQVSGHYTPEYYKINNKYYYIPNGSTTYTSSTSEPAGVYNFNYSYEIISGGANASISGSTVTYTKDAGEDVDVIVRVTASPEGYSSVTRTADCTFTLRSATLAAPVITRIAGTNQYQITYPTGAQCKYTVDGTDIDQWASNGSTYSDVITVTTSGTVIKAKAVRDGTVSAQTEYTVTDVILEAPVISFADDGTVTITNPNTFALDATIYYTTDDSEPTTSSTVYNGTFKVSNNATVKAIVAKTGYATSAVAENSFNISSGVSGGVVTLNDYEDHTWTYYSGVDSSVDGGNYNTNYAGKLYSPNPRNVKITYRGNGQLTDGTAVTGVKVGIDADASTFVYYKTIEDNDGYKYITIPNPFSVRPKIGSTYYGFTSWKVISVTGGTITGHAVNSTIDAETEITFVPTSTYTTNCTSMEVVLEAVWDVAEVSTNGSFSKGYNSVERNFYVITSSENSNITASSTPCTYTSLYPNGTTNGTTAATNVTVYRRGGFTPAADSKFEYINLNDNTSTVTIGSHNLTYGRGVSYTSGSRCVTNLQGISGNVSGLQYKLRVESGTFRYMMFTSGRMDSNSRRTISGTVDIDVILGSDYDRAIGDNTKFICQNDIIYGYDVTTSNTTAGGQVFKCVMKSGELNASVSSVGTADLPASFYVGIGSVSNAGYRIYDMEGGIIKSLAAGICTNTKSTNSIYFRIRGGQVLGSIYGSAANATSYGYKRIIVTGGQVKGWIAGGGNGTSANGGYTYGTSYIYIGGNAKIDSEGSTTKINSSLGGNVFGSGSGVENNTEWGEMTYGSNVVVADNSEIERNVFGGGNYGWTLTNANMYVTGGDVKGNLYGGANQNKGEYANVYMTGGLVEGGIYGGSNTSGTLSGNVTMQINGGQVGTSSTAANIHGGGYGSNTKVSGNVAVTLGTEGQESNGVEVYGNVYGGSALGTTGGSGKSTTVTVNKGSVHGNVFGGGLGEASSTIEGVVTGSITVTVNGTDPKPSDTEYALTGVYGGGDYAPYSGTPVVSVHNCDNSIEYVYGGANATSVSGTDVTIYGGNKIGNVFGGGNGQIRAADVNGDTNVKVYGGTIGDVYGGSNTNGTISGTINVTVNAQAEGDKDACQVNIDNVYGGGNKAASQAGNITIGCADHIGAVYGGANQANVTGDIALNIRAGNIDNVFGGNNNSGTISGTIAVNVNEDKTTYPCGMLLGNVYGGGNLASYTGSPTVSIINGKTTGSVFGGGKGTSAVVVGDPVVTIADWTNTTSPVTIGGSVFGGGDEAAVEGNPSVTINRCDTQIGGDLYGGGNAAPTYSTNLTMWGGTVLGNVFGGGNGADANKPAANIGYSRDNTTKAGTGIAKAAIYGGTIGTWTDATTCKENTGGIFGGSNTKGDIAGHVDLTVDHKGYNNDDTKMCDFKINEMYAGGNKAPLDAKDDMVFTLGCIDELDAIYGGAKASDMKGNVNLEITSGTFKKVFGGNNLSGTLTGTVKVTVRESGCKPVIIGDLYGGGNLAPYAGTPEIDVISCTSIGNIYGGGLGAGATVTGTNVNINQVPGTYAAQIDADGNGSPDNNANALGTIGNVFGGGNAAAVNGNTSVKIGTTNNTANITGNVFGGGNNAEVTGKTNVVIGADKQ